MMDFQQSVRLSRLQSRLWWALEEALREDGVRKSDDGRIDVTFGLPPAFDWNEAPTWTLTIHSYVLCDGARRETFSAPSLDGVLAMAEAYANRICFMPEMARFEREIGGLPDDGSSADDADIPH